MCIYLKPSFLAVGWGFIDPNHEILMIFDSVFSRMNPRTLAMLMVKYFKKSTKNMVGEIEGNQSKPIYIVQFANREVSICFFGALFQPEAGGHDPV